MVIRISSYQDIVYDYFLPKFFFRVLFRRVELEMTRVQIDLIGIKSLQIRDPIIMIKIRTKESSLTHIESKYAQYITYVFIRTVIIRYSCACLIERGITKSKIRNCSFVSSLFSCWAQTEIKSLYFTS